MAPPIEFDPLVELAGLWNTQLAERHLPICAAAKIPYFTQIEVDQRLDDVHIDLLRLESGRYVPVGPADVGERFEVDEPLRLSFDPAVLLEP